MGNKKNKKTSSSSDSDTSVEDRSPPPAKKPKTSSSSEKKPKDDGEPSWCLEKNRFVKVREFRGKVMVDIREYYEKDGELLPGKKGISLSTTQWKKLKNLVEEIDEKVSEA